MNASSTRDESPSSVVAEVAQQFDGNPFLSSTKVEVDFLQKY
jgi:hypothetical protein